MVRRLATIDEDGVLRPGVKIPEASLPSWLSEGELKTAFATPRIAHYDVFDRPDGAVGTAPTGQTYMTHQSVTNGLGKIVGGEFVSTRKDGVTNAISSYIGINFNETPVKFVQRFTQLGSSTGVSAASIVYGGRADGADSTISDIIDRSVHLICTATGINLQFRDKVTYPDGVYPSIAVSSFGRLPNTTAGQEYEWSVTRIAPDVLEVVDPNGKVNIVQHPDIERLAGRAVYWQCVEQQATGGNETRLQGLWTYTGPLGQTLPPLKSATKRPLDVASTVSTPGEIAHLATNGLATEIDVVNRTSNIISTAITSSKLYLSYFTPERDISVSRCEFGAGTTWATGNTLFQYGLFSVNTAGDLTLLARTDPANTAGFTFADQITERAFQAAEGFPSAVALKAGSRYALGVLIVATSPGEIKALVVDKTITRFRNPIITSVVNSTTTMPTAVAVASTSSNGFMPWARLKV
jgi:hypothetical protein